MLDMFPYYTIGFPKEEHADGKYIPKRSTKIKNKRKNKRRKKHRQVKTKR